jgi:hypothetical protein
MTDTGAYVRRYYNVPAEIGTRVEVIGEPGVITGFDGQYLLVRFAPGAEPQPCHPTYSVQYFAERVDPDANPWFTPTTLTEGVPQ